MQEVKPAPAYPAHHYQHPHHAQIIADYDLKRRYLALLPPQQIIEICLAFDYHVPPYIKGSVWPMDLNAAIETLKSMGVKKQDAIMDALIAPTQEPPAEPKEPEEPAAKPVEDKPPDTGQPTAGAANGATPEPPGAPPYPYSMPPGYGYPSHPYYYPPWPYYPPPHPGMQYPPPPGAPAPYPPSAVMPPGHEQPTVTPGQGDVPSYEEMLIEALTETDDPDGLMAPKDLFNWMASRYPLQSNFRPSASQALQRAYRRGRFEKTKSGKYRLSQNFSGNSANVARRASRRPPSVTSSQPNQPLPPPFTKAPLNFHPPPTPQAPSETSDDERTREAVLEVLKQIGLHVAANAEQVTETAATNESNGVVQRRELHANLMLLSSQLAEFGNNGVIETESTSA